MAARPAINSFDAMTLGIAARHSCPPQLRIFMEALATSLSQVAGDEQALRVLAGAGVAIAREQAIPASNSLAELKAAMNTGLHALGWGQVDVYEAERALEFVVVGYPYFEGGEAQTAFAAILEAVLEGWLTQHTARPGLAMRLAERGGGSYPPLVFRYERSGL